MMSRNHPLATLTFSLIILGVLPAGSVDVPARSDSAVAQTARQSVPLKVIENLLIADDIERAESLIKEQPRTAQTTALEGEVAFRRGDFQAAESHYRSALKMEANVARAHFGMGKLAMARLRVKDAKKFFMRAVQIDAAEPLYRLYASEAWGMDKRADEQKKQLEAYIRLNPVNDPDHLTQAKASVEILRALGPEVAVIDAPEQIKPIRLRESLHLMFADVMIDGQGPYQFAIDTGATATVVSKRVADDLKLRPITTTVIHGVGGQGKTESTIYRVGQVNLGEVKIKNIAVGTFNDPLLAQLADGIFSTALLADFRITINYPQKRLDLSRKPLPTPADSLPAWYFNNLLLVPITANGKNGNFIVDTGAVTTVLSHRMAEALGVTEQTPGAKIDIGLAGVGGFQGAVLRVPDVRLQTPKNVETFPQVVSIDLKQVSKLIGTEVAGVLGYDFFEKYQLTIDYSDTTLGLSR